MTEREENPRTFGGRMETGDKSQNGQNKQGSDIYCDRYFTKVKDLSSFSTTIRISEIRNLHLIC